MTPEQLANLPLQVLSVLAVIALWRAYSTVQNARVEDLKSVISDLQPRLLMIEDKLGIKAPLTTHTFDKPDKP